MLTWLTQQVWWNFLCLSYRAFFKLQQLGSIVAVFVCLIASDKLSQECESWFFLQTCKILVILDQNFILLLSPLIFVSDFVLFLHIVNFKNRLVVSKDDIVIICSLSHLVFLAVGLFVDKTSSGVTQRVVAQNLVFDLLRLESKHGFHCQHRIVDLELHELANN